MDADDVSSLPAASSFFTQLKTFSERIFQLWGLPAGGSPNGATSLTNPVGTIIHYSVGTLESSVRWFCDPSQKSGVSAHVVVGRQRYRWAEGALQGLPLIQALPVTVVQCRTPTAGAYHATWLNGRAFGIENECLGKAGIEAVGTSIRQPGLAARNYQPFDRALWDTYPPEQIAANLTLLTAYRALSGPAFNPAYILGHEQVESLATIGYPTDKRDPGPLYPLDAVRAAAQSNAPGPIQALADTLRNAEPGYGAMRRRSQILAPFVPNAVPFAQVWQSVLNGQTPGPKVAVIPACRLLLRLLGYLMTEDANATYLSDTETKSVFIAQTCLGLVADSKPGPKTLAALRGRVKDRF